MCCGYGPKQATYIVLCKQSILGAGESPVLDMSVLTNPSLSATFKCWLMAEIQAPEDSVSFSDSVNLEMSKFFSVMLPIVKKKEKKRKIFTVAAQRVGPLVPLLSGVCCGGAHGMMPSTSHCTSVLFCVLFFFKIGYK